MEKKNILVFPCGSEIALDIHSSVKYSTYFHLIGANSVDDHGKYVYEDYISDLPFVTDDEIVPALQKIISDRKIDAIYPTMDLVITRLKHFENELGCSVISSPLDTVETCLSKRHTYEILKDNIKTPKLFSQEGLIEYPVFLKPNVGYGAKGTKLIHNEKELKANIKPDLLICEFLPGEEYTVDCFTDRFGKLRYCAARKRNRVKDGISVNTFFAESQDEFQTIAESINSRVKFRGAWFYQVKRNRTGQLCLLEIASRLGGSSLLSRGVGVNFALLTLFDHFGYDIEILKNDYFIELDRALISRYNIGIEYETVYVDYDDCLILENKFLNVELVAFLYKCLNHGKKIKLLTKHEGHLEEGLKRFRIYNLFDEIVHINPDQKKSDFIMENDAIFIDDSYSERLNVKLNKNLYVFSPDMVDVLI